MELEFTISSEGELGEISKEILKRFPEKKIFLFEGEMGSGKTTFIKAFCKQLGCEDDLSSPTYSIINEYVNKNGEKIFHADLYRLKSVEEALDLGIETYLDSTNYFFIEWPQIVESLIFEPYLQIKIKTTGQQREIVVRD